MNEETVEPSLRSRPGGLLVRVCPLVSTVSREWFDELLRSGDPRGMLVDLLVSTDQMSLGELVPLLQGLSGDAPLFELPTRTRNCLQREGVTTWESVTALDPAHVRGFNNAGELTVRSVVSWCLTKAESLARNSHELRTVAPIQRRADDAAPGEDASTPEADPWARVRPPIARLLRAGRDYHGATTLADVLNGPLAQTIEALGLTEDLNAISLEDLIPEEPSGTLIRTRLDQIATNCQHIERGLIQERVYVNDPATLDELGERFDVTRERIRQVQVRLMSHIDEAVGDLLREAVALWGLTLPSVTTEDHLQSKVKEFLGTSPEPGNGEGLAVRCVIAELGYATEEGLRLSASAVSELEGMQSLAQHEADSVGLVDEELLRESFPEFVDSGHWDELLAAGGLHRVGQSLCLRKTAKAQVKAALLQIGRPATKAEIAAVSGLDVKRLGSQLSVIDDVARSDKNRWGLLDWIDDIYEGIPAEIMQRIEEDGGVTSVERVLEELPRLFDVSEGSVRSYLSTSQFTVRDGHVSITDPSTLTYRNLVDVIDGTTSAGDPFWTFTVEDRYLHGYSVLGMPPEIARELGCGPNDSVRIQLRSPSGCEQLSIVWRLSATTGGASLGYLSEPLKALGALVGTVVRLEVHNDQTASIAAHQEAPGDGAAGANDLLRRIKERRRAI